MEQMISIDKFLTVGDLRELELLHKKGEISYSKMVELINEKAIKWAQFPCVHTHLVMVEETPTDGKICQPTKFYVKCGNCGHQMYTTLITKETIEIPLYPEFE